MQRGHAKHWLDVRGAAFEFSGKQRTYYLQAEEIQWDYAPLGYNAITGKPFDEADTVFVGSEGPFVGSKYLKVSHVLARCSCATPQSCRCNPTRAASGACSAPDGIKCSSAPSQPHILTASICSLSCARVQCVYRAYTDDTFTDRKPHDAQLGILGPVIHAAVGDRVKVVFHNTCRFPASVHAHGVLYTKGNEGSPDPLVGESVAARKLDDSVATGVQQTYHWKVPERAGPGPADGSSRLWMYHSHVNEIGDTYSGLTGPLVITAKEDADEDGAQPPIATELQLVMFLLIQQNYENLPRLGSFWFLC